MDSTENSKGASRTASAKGHQQQLPAAPQEVHTGVSSDPNLLSAERLNGLSGNPRAHAAARSPWGQRVWLIVFVVFSVELGMLLAVLPWTRVWSENSLLYPYPAVRSILQQGFVRGLATGLGLLDIWIGIWQAVHYRETK
jgi:hypothetical protein